MKYVPHPYQVRATEWVLSHEGAAVFLDMGMGKSVITLTAVDGLLSIGEAEKVLVIAPLRVAQDTWTREAAKWDHTRHLRIAKVLGSESQRIAALKETAEIYVINRENVPWLVRYYAKRWPFDLVVIDELSSFKASDSQRFRALRSVRPQIKRVIGLTGTPAPNGLMDLWPQIFLLDAGARLGRTITRYREEWFRPGRHKGHVVYEWLPKAGAADEIYGRLQDLCLSMSADDYLQLPERVDRIVPLALPGSAMTLYRAMEASLITQVADTAIVAASAAVAANKLLQMTGGAVYDELGEAREIHSVKLDALDDLIEAANGNPVLVFYGYRHDLERIRRRQPEARELRTAEDIADWNSGKVPVMLAHPAGAGHGLNLQDGGHQVVWFSLPWSLELYQQANARLHRQGQQHPVVVHHLIAEGTIDERVMRVLADKEAGQEALLRAVYDGRVLPEVV